MYLLTLYKQSEVSRDIEIIHYATKSKNFINRPFPDFLSSKEGIIYYILLFPILSITLIILQPRGLYNWIPVIPNWLVRGVHYK